MIRVGIAGADTAMAGELIRILINHPDVELVSAFAPGKVGRKVASVHHGLAGECELEFSPDINPKNLDVIFIDAHSDVADRFRMNTDRWPDLRIIDMSHCPSLDFDALDMAYGLPETNRKQLVRGCRRAVVPRSVAAAAIIGLYPLARHLLLKGDIYVDYACPKDIDTEEKMNMVRQEILYVLKKTQNSFYGNIILRHLDEEVSDRGLKVTVEIPCSLDINEVFKIFDDCYEDHNFTFMLSNSMPGYEVEGTQKTLVTLQKQTSDRLTITIIADSRMRGGAGDAVHIMNLLFGLHERTGLYLKAHKF
ncbi:MAG: hypothetical protein K2I08_11340 [Muribaculaceae bacterium]|nr:hypothetical protein [Muribaculaceae bacterium]MDE6522235.1 hypothetical protein [Muribaculaceae bacterium]